MRPEEKDKLFGYTKLSSREEICAGNIGSWLITYTAGLHGIDDNGFIIITRRAADDSSIPQFNSPEEEGFIQVTTDGDVILNVAFQEKYHIRPNRAAIIISVHDGSLKQGEKILIDIGGIQKNHPGYRIQSFPENKHRFLTFLDAYGTGEYVKVKSPALRSLLDLLINMKWQPLLQLVLVIPFPFL